MLLIKLLEQTSGADLDNALAALGRAMQQALHTPDYLPLCTAYALLAALLDNSENQV